MPTDFKTFSTLNFDNVKIKGMYEWQMKPIELIINVTFSVVPTPFSLNEGVENFSSELKNQLSLFAIDRAVKSSGMAKSWKYDGSRYTYGHDYSQVRIEERVSSLGVDLYFIQTDRDSQVEDFFTAIVQEVAGLMPFKSTEYFVIRPNRKNATNHKHQQAALTERP